MKHVLSLVVITMFLMFGLSQALSQASAADTLDVAQRVDKKSGNGTLQPGAPTAVTTTVPLLILSHSCLDFNFKDHDASTGMGFGAVQFNAGETLNITGEAPFTVQINPGGNSYPTTSFTYTFPSTATYSIKIISGPQQGPQHFEFHCTILPPLPAGLSPSPTPILAASPISFSQNCKSFNFKDKDAGTGMSFGAVQFIAGETLTITGEAPFTVQINPGGKSYPTTSFTYTFPGTVTYSIMIVSSPKQVSQHFEFHCTILPPPPAGMSPSPTPTLFAPDPLTGLQVSPVGTTDPKVCQPFKFLSVKPYGPARLSWTPPNHASQAETSSEGYWYRVIISAVTNDHATVPLVDGWVNEPSPLAQPPAIKATFAYELPPTKRIQTYTVTVVAGYGSADYPDHQDDSKGYLKQDCTISMTLLATLPPTPMPPTSTAVSAPPVPI